MSLPTAPSSINGITSSSVVPGKEVERTHTVYGVVRSERASPIWRATARRWLRSVSPVSRLGVPTQTSATSLPATASWKSSVARNRPAATISATSSGSPGSTTGDRPSLIIATLSGLGSTPITVWPSRARQAAETAPTYPNPNTATDTEFADPLIVRDAFARRARSRRSRVTRSPSG